MESTNGHTDIPSVFFSDKDNAPFQRCQVCDVSLLESGREYFVEKAFRTYPDFSARDTVFEYAICLQCYAKIQDQISRESIHRIQNYLSQWVQATLRPGNPTYSSPDDPEAGLSTCAIKGTPIHALREYQIVGFFRGGAIVPGIQPYAIGGDVIDEMTELLSAKTRDEIDGFTDRYFGLPPELRNLFLDNPLVII